MKKLPGIFNDVIGPVMRGPSSSHTAASWRIARTALDIFNGDLKKALIEFDRDRAWAPNYREQGTCMGIEGGLLGLSMTDEKMKDTESCAREQRVAIDYKVSSYPTKHPNTVRLSLFGDLQKKVEIVAVSTGGGSFEIQFIDGFEVKLNGDVYELIFVSSAKPDLREELRKRFPSNIELLISKKEGINLYELKSSHAFSPEIIARLQGHPKIEEIVIVNPVMPIISGLQTEMPFKSIESLLKYAEKSEANLGDLGLIYEENISGLAESELTQKMGEIVQIIQKSIYIGLEGTQYKDRILHQQSHLIKKAEKEGKIKPSVVNQIISNVTALMESKSAMEVIVAVPTAGSCGVVGGSLFAVAQSIESTQEELVTAYFAAGIVGAYFAQGPGFSAEEHGCQVECGAASGMAAAAMIQLMGGTAKQALDAASMAIQNMIGLVCDPVADRVEVPCLGKNLSAAMNAYSSAIMAISGFDAVIPLDQVIHTVSEVSKTMPTCVKCTGKGGLALTKTSRLIKESLQNRSI